MFYLRVCLCTMCMPGAHMGQERVLDSLGTEVTDGCEPLCGCWKSSLCPQEEQPVIISTEQSLQLKIWVLFKPGSLFYLQKMLWRLLATNSSGHTALLVTCSPHPGGLQMSHREC